MQRHEAGIEALVCLFLANLINLGTQRLVHLRETDLRTRTGIWFLKDLLTGVASVRERASRGEYPCKLFRELGISLMSLSSNTTPLLPLPRNHVIESEGMSGVYRLLMILTMPIG